MADTLTLYKLIVLKMLEQIDAPLTNSRISEFILDKGYTNYFSLQQSLSEMVETGHVEVTSDTNSTWYHITDSGRKTLGYLGNKLSDAICQDIKEYFRENGLHIKSDLSTIADYYLGKQNDYLVHCQVLEQNATLIDLTLSVPSEKQAISVCLNWKGKSQEIYAHVMKELL